MKKSWISPKIEIQKFFPNEYCASTCLTLSCDKNGPFHNGTCKNGNTITVESNGTYTITENRDKNQKLHGYTSGDLTKESIGTVIEWTTWLGLVPYYHSGTLKYQDSNHPNHS